MPPKRGPAPPNPDRSAGNVQVGRGRSKYVYADLTKHLLANGQPEVEVTALGGIISDAVAVVEMLKNQGLVTVTKIETSRGEGTNARSANTDKIAIWVKKTAAFDAEYERQMSERNKAKEEAAAKAGDDKAE